MIFRYRKKFLHSYMDNPKPNNDFLASLKPIDYSRRRALIDLRNDLLNQFVVTNCPELKLKIIEIEKKIDTL